MTQRRFWEDVGSPSIWIDYGNHKVTFSLRGVPYIEQYVERDAETQQLEEYLHAKSPGSCRRKVFVIHGLGGIGKTQFASAYARNNQHRYSAVFWLNGSSRDTVKQSFVDIALRLPQDEASPELKQILRDPKIDVDIIINSVHQWLSLPSNQYWLLIFDNVDLDYLSNNRHPLAYDVKGLFPQADHGSIIITSQLENLSRLGKELTLKRVNNEQAIAILENNARQSLQGTSIVIFDYKHYLTA